MNNSYKVVSFTNDNYLNIIAYEENTFNLIFKESTKEDYIKTDFPVDYPYDAIKHQEEKLNKVINGSRFIVIDDEFITWCKNNNREYNLTNIEQYSKILSDMDANKLWIKSGRSYDLIMCSIPIIVKYYYDNTKYSRYYNFTEEILREATSFLSFILNINNDNIIMYPISLTKDDALNNVHIIEDYFKNSFEKTPTNHNLIKSIFDGYEENCFTIKYIICGIKIDREYKMSKALAIKDSEVDIDKLLVKDEMITFSDILSSKNPNYVIYPAFDRIIGIKEIESSENMLKKYLPQILLNCE